jgi:hypothetical protein
MSDNKDTSVNVVVNVDTPLNNEVSQTPQPLQPSTQGPELVEKNTDQVLPPKPEPVHDEFSNIRVSAEQIDEIVRSIEDVLGTHKLTPEILFRIVANCMAVAKNMKVQNHNKKEIVIQGLSKFISRKSGLGQAEVELLLGMVNQLVDDAVDTIADVGNGTIDVKSKKGCCAIM